MRTRSLVEQLVDVLERNFADDQFSWVLGPDQRVAPSRAVAGTRACKPS